MNKFTAIDVSYLRPSRTIETILVSDSHSSRVFYVYNYEGYSFRIFNSLVKLVNFVNNESESNFHFNTENELDEFFSTVDLRQ